MKMASQELINAGSLILNFSKSKYVRYKFLVCMSLSLWEFATASWNYGYRLVGDSLQR